eukprot:7111289-Alexandrium_andersonii.AAC.1
MTIGPRGPGRPSIGRARGRRPSTGSSCRTATMRPCTGRQPPRTRCAPRQRPPTARAWLP